MISSLKAALGLKKKPNKKPKVPQNASVNPKDFPQKVPATPKDCPARIPSEPNDYITKTTQGRQIEPTVYEDIDESCNEADDEAEQDYDEDFAVDYENFSTEGLTKRDDRQDQYHYANMPPVYPRSVSGHFASSRSASAGEGEDPPGRVHHQPIITDGDSETVNLQSRRSSQISRYVNMQRKSDSEPTLKDCINPLKFEERTQGNSEVTAKPSDKTKSNPRYINHDPLFSKSSHPQYANCLSVSSGEPCREGSLSDDDYELCEDRPAYQNVEKTHKRAQSLPQQDIAKLTKCTLDQSPILDTPFTDGLIQGAISKYYATPNRQTGVCYASAMFAIGEFDTRGGVLTPANNDSIKLTIPPGALNKLRLVYLLVLFENNSPGDETENISPTIECGPDGLHFQSPVELLFPHSAVGSDVGALTCEGGSTTWHEDNSRDGPVLLNTTTEIISMRILHFTKYKASRIPVRSLGNSVDKTTSPSGKRLSLCVFHSGEKCRIYCINNPSSTTMLQQVIDKRESRLGFQRDSPWKDFIFYTEQGRLIIEAVREIHGQKCSYKKFSFTEKKVLLANQESVEIIAMDKSVLLDIIIYQAESADDYTQFCVKLESCAIPSYSLESVYSRRRVESQELQSMMLNLELHPGGIPYEDKPYEDMSPWRPIPSPRRFTLNTCTADTIETCDLPPDRSPEETCDHSGEACSCWKDRARSPQENEYGEVHNLALRAASKRSKESGYESCAAQSPQGSPQISPLKGPTSMDSLDGVSPFSSDLELNVSLNNNHPSGRRHYF